MNAPPFADLATTAVLLASAASAQCSWMSQGVLTPAGGYGSEPQYFARSLALCVPELLVGSPGLEGATGTTHLFVQSPDGWVPSDTLVAAGLQPYDDFGRAVALDGDFAAVGAPLAAGGLGRVHVFEHTPAGWNEVAVLSAPPGAAGHFGESLALAGSVLLAGAPLAGAVVVYERGPAGWTKAAQLEPEEDAESFGASLAFDGARAVVGAPDDEEAFVFEPGPGGWTETARLEAEDDFVEAEFGTSVALSGDTIAVGAQGEVGDEAPSGGGAVYLFRFAGSWSTEAVVPAPSGQAGVRFGASVALDGDVLAVGSPGDQGGLGRVYAYLRVEGYWFEAAALIPYLDPTETEGQFGSVVVLEGDALLANIGLDETGLIALPYVGAALAWTASAIGCDLLLRDVAAIGVDAGGTQALLLGAGSDADPGPIYLVLGSASGTYPGTLLGLLALPLNLDPYFVWTATQPNEGPLGSTFGTFVPGTPAIATLTLPPSSPVELVGLTLHHAFVAIDPADPFFFVDVSNPVALDLVP